MKKETTNVFNKGLVYDLNPLTTPNNVLTDCLNGTFITFNGDELSLQNDAGNAVIKTKSASGVEGKVELSPGFRPLGIKEFGGVLYIISGKLPTLKAESIPKWVRGTNYTSGTVVYNDTSIKIFYRSKGTNQEIPLESNSAWDIIGTEEDYNNADGLVEIGSYPSPEASGYNLYIGDTNTYNDSSVWGTNIVPQLYKYNTINKEFFKSGRYVYFNRAEVGNTANISGYNDNLTYRYNFYKVKLYHQLNNGYLDLTTNVWNKFLYFKKNLPTPEVISNTSYWFTDSRFKYYCPSQYKGRLALTLEIEDLKTFKLSTIPSVSLITGTPSTYNFTLGITAENFPGSTVTIPNAKIEILIDDIVKASQNITITNTKGTYTLSGINLDQQDKLIKYKITPILGVIGDANTYSNIDLPKEFIDKYTIKGNMLVSSNYDKIKFLRVDSNFECDFNTGTKIYNEYILINSSNEYLGLNLEPQGTPYIFLRDGKLTKTLGSPVTIGNYTLVGDKPKMTIPLNVIFEDSIIITMFEQESVVINDAECINIPVLNTINLTLDFGYSICYNFLLRNMDPVLNGEFIVTYCDGTVDSVFVPPNKTRSALVCAQNIQIGIEIGNNNLFYEQKTPCGDSNLYESINVTIIQAGHDNIIFNGYPEAHKVQKNIPLSIQITRPGFNNVNISSDGYSIDTTVNVNFVPI